MCVHLFCPQCQTYLGRRDACCCGWARPESVALSGRPCWQAQLPASIVGPILLTPQGEAALVGYGARSGEVGGLACVELDGGEVRWQHEVGAAVEGGAALGKNRVALFGDRQGRLHGLRLTDGQPAWEPPSLDGPITTAPLVAQGIRAYVGTARGTLYCLDWRTGREVWHKTLPRRPRRPRPRIAARPAWVEGRVWIGAYDGHLCALDGDTGHLTDVYDAGGEIRTPLQVAGRWLIFGTNAGTLHAVDLRSGQDAWSPFHAGRGIPAAPLLHEGVLYVPSLGHKLYAVELASGQPLWSLDLGHGLATTPAWVEGGWLVLGSNGGEVIVVDVAVDVEQREVIWRYAVNDGMPDEHGRPFPVLGSPAIHNGIVYVGAGDGRLYALPWHGGEWERASDVLTRAGRMEEAAACLALSPARDAEVRAARLLLEHSRPGLAARVYQALGQVTEAARAYEQAAKSKVGAEAATVWEWAGALWLQLDEARRAQVARQCAAQARGDLLLDIEWVGNTAFREGEASHVHLRVTNPTRTTARRLHIIAGGEEFTPVERERVELVTGNAWDCRLEGLIPQCAGTATLNIEARCEGDQGRAVTYRWQFQIQVAGRDQPPIDGHSALKVVIQGDYVAGDKHTDVDQRGQTVHGPQTTIAGDVSGPVASGQFESATTVGGGEATDHRGGKAQE